MLFEKIVNNCNFCNFDMNGISICMMYVHVSALISNANVNKNHSLLNFLELMQNHKQSQNLVSIQCINY